MSIIETDRRLVFDRADYMRKALELSGLDVQTVADRIEVHRNTISSWINGRNNPRPRDLRRFAEVTGVPLEWLEESRPRESNPRPSHYE